VIAFPAERFPLTSPAPIHVELTASPDKPLSTETLARLQQANDSFDAWARYWDRRLGGTLHRKEEAWWFLTLSQKRKDTRADILCASRVSVKVPQHCRSQHGR
jgi:hypothetical protein